MKNSFSSFKNKFISKYTVMDENLNENKSTNINVLLNRVKLDQKKESRKKIIFTAATSLNDTNPKHFASQTAESKSNSGNIYTNTTNDRYTDVTHLRLKGVPVGFGLLLQKFFSYISAWYKHYHPVRMIQSSLAGKFIRPLPFLLRSKSIILSDNLPSQEDIKKCLYD